MSTADLAALVAASVSAAAAIVLAAFTLPLAMYAKRTLALEAYSRAVDSLVGIKSRFAERPTEFHRQMVLLGEEAAMSGMPAEVFLDYASALWRFSYIYSLMTDTKLKLTKDEREGLDRELRLWLGLPGFREVFRNHTKHFKAHNPAFLDFLEGFYGETSDHAVSA
jgi:hypothetical protein